MRRESRGVYEKCCRANLNLDQDIVWIWRVTTQRRMVLALEKYCARDCIGLVPFDAFVVGWYGRSVGGAMSSVAPCVCVLVCKLIINIEHSRQVETTI